MGFMENLLIVIGFVTVLLVGGYALGYALIIILSDDNKGKGGEWKR